MTHTLTIVEVYNGTGRAMTGWNNSKFWSNEVTGMGNKNPREASFV
jgi:hypothetical protein